MTAIMSTNGLRVLINYFIINGGGVRGTGMTKLRENIKKGRKVSQGDIIGYVGSTGLATGPHLDYRIKSKGKFVDPLKIRLPRGKSIPGKLMAEFDKAANAFNSRLALLKRRVIAFREVKKKATS